MEYRPRPTWMNASLPAGSLAGVRIAIHWTFFLLLVVHTLIAGVEHGAEWAGVSLSIFVLLFGIILAHEFGHVFAARREGIESDRVMLWPLGGVAMLGQEAVGGAEVRIAAAGPAVNLLFAIALLPVLWLSGFVMDFALLNPLDFWPEVRSGAPDFAQKVLYGVYKANLIVLLFNLIPAFPMDGGRILRGALYRKYGYLRSVIVATSVAFAFCVLMLVWAILARELILGLIAVFVAFDAWRTRRHAMAMSATEPDEGFMGYDFSMGNTSLAKPSAEERREEKRAERERRRREREQEREREMEAEVDRILDKITREGMESLTRRERSFLERASRKKR